MPNFIKGTSVIPPVSTNDHCTVSVDISFKIPHERPYERIIWLYKKGDFVGFRNALANENWESCFANQCPNDACYKWCERFLNIARIYIPNKCVLIRPRDVPWYNNQLRNTRRKVHRLFNLAKRTKNQYHWEHYTAARNDYHNQLKCAEIDYKKNLSKKLMQSKNSKYWWNTVKQMLGRGGDDSYPPIHDPTSHQYISDSKEKANLFNRFFLSHSQIDTSSTTLPHNNDRLDFTLSYITATENEVSDLLKSLDTSKACGPDGISPKLLKEAGYAIVPSLTKLINLSLNKCIVPTAWKKANVIPLHKKGSKDNLTNYRPVSLLPIPGKILEKIVFKHVYNFFHSHNLLTKHQSGFRPGDSTVNQLAYLYHTFCEALDKKKDIRIVFFDISKAFDKVWHEGLIFKLRKIGITGNLLEWFKDYLHGRSQRVIIRGQSSDWGLLKATGFCSWTITISCVY